jgi:UDP-N-acetylmuramoyl-L-alanyl-D-glutamate--2,6-diaminopimelate ligase
MARIAESYADGVVVTDDNPRGEDAQVIVAEILAGFADPARARVQQDRAMAIRDAIQQARPGDTVLIAGKGHETWQEIAGERLPFDDSAHAANCLGVAA